MPRRSFKEALYGPPSEYWTPDGHIVSTVREGAPKSWFWRCSCGVESQGRNLWKYANSAAWRHAHTKKHGGESFRKAASASLGFKPNKAPSGVEPLQEVARKPRISRDFS